MDPATPRAEAFAVKDGRFVAVGSTADDQGARRQAHADVRREADDDRAGLHRQPQSRGRHARCSTKCSSAIRSRSSSSRSPASSRSCARRRSRRRRARGSRATSTTTRSSRTSARSTSTISIRCRPSIRSPCSIAAATRRSTTARRSSWRGSRRTRRIPPGGTFDRDANGELNGRVTDRARNALSRVGQRPSFTPPSSGAARPRRHRAHLEAVRALRPDERASRGRRPDGDPGRARARRSACIA